MFDINKFDKKAFNKEFSLSLKKIGNAEKVTRAVLGELSRTVLAQLHTDEDIRPVNELLAVLTPVNRKVALAYFKGLSGFKVSEESETFTEKNKGNYAKKRADAEAFLTDPENNIWTWADRNIEVTPKEFKLEAVTKGIISFFDKAQKANVDRKEVLKAILAGGIKMDEMVAIMGELAQQEEAANAPQQQAVA
ncbi:MAG: hypothetical protein [Podoviridae sp. ctbj_2]|nr:MAG: hypothetical protein [Podoviridae sp. ctbj_2]